MMFNKNTPTRTYGRTSKPKEEAVSFLNVGLPVEYETSCRLCLEQTDVMTEIFSYNDIIPIFFKMRSVLDLEVNEDDHLPALICEGCLNQLNEAFHFKKRCLANDVYLRQLIKWPSKFSGYKSTQSKEHVSDPCMNDEFVASELTKNECTIDWDDQVPLAAMITSKPDSYMVCNEPVNVGGSQTELAIKSVSGAAYNRAGNSPDECVENSDDSEEVEEPQNEISRRPNKSIKNPDKSLKSPDSTLGSSQDSEYRVHETSKYVYKVKKTESVDMDNLPLDQWFNLKQMEEDPLTALKEREKLKKNKTGVLDPLHSRPIEIIQLSDKHKGRKYFRYLHACSCCPKTFLSRSLLRRHLRVHTGEKPFTCSTCSKSFTQKEVLMRHIAQIHSKSKPHKCRLCGKSFGLLQLLSAHVRINHLRRGQYKCKHCKKIFQHASGLSRHQNTHNGTLYYCKICGKDFADGSSVKRHIKIHKTK